MLRRNWLRRQTGPVLYPGLNPDIAVLFDDAGDDAWLTAAVSSGEAPDLMSRLDLVQRGWCVPIDDWLDAPSPYAPNMIPGPTVSMTR